MKFNFKTLSYQTDAVMSIIDVFRGQEYSCGIKHRHDLGSTKEFQSTFDTDDGTVLTDADVAYRNNDFTLSDTSILENIQTIQLKSGLSISREIIEPLGKVTLDIEMETGTGKTYVYTKAMFELNRTYGWSKFIIVVPSVAIREGVYKSIQITEDHFMEMYGKKLRAFVYNSTDLQKIDGFSQNSGINVMIINSQAFASSLKENGDAQSRIIYSIRDEFQSRRPIDIIAANKPILILDEPQKLGKHNSVTQKALRKHFNALFSMNFSATHATNHNQIYSLDALDAYNQKLVKKICVKGVKIRHLSGSERYIYVERVEPGKNNPIAHIEILVSHKTGIRSETRVFNPRDNLYEASNHLETYNGLFIKDIDVYTNTVSLSDGSIIHSGEAVGDVTESGKRRIQIRETILSHLEKESRLYSRGIKVLSLFFIDEVAKYRRYDEDGEPFLGEYGVIFEEELKTIISEREKFYEPDYIASLKKFSVSDLHTGYFSIDKGRAVDSKIPRWSESSEDERAYDLILKNKEKLLSQDNPVRFIFSHSALSEGWDNPNVFQICVLKHSESMIRRRQEVGRGMRICVDQNGDRQDFDTLGPLFHDVNSLTVVADEEYDSFVKGLQEEMAPDLRPRSTAITVESLIGKKIQVQSNQIKLSEMYAKTIHRYLTDNWYIDLDYEPTDKLRTDIISDSLLPLPEVASTLQPGIRQFLWKLSMPQTIADITEDGRRPKIRSNRLNSNFEKKEFLELWNQINHKYHYRVSFESEELIHKAVESINSNLLVSGVTYTVTKGNQKSTISYDEAVSRNGFEESTTHSGKVDVSLFSNVKYDLIGKIKSNTNLTRKTVATILKQINNSKFDLFKTNPEEFIQNVSALINEVKATTVVDHIEYMITDQRFENSIFTMNRPERDFTKAYEAKKNVQDYVFPDSEIERKFVQDLDEAEEITVYSKLPDGKDGFYIPTPMGNYTPDWAIAYKQDNIQHVFFVAETKGGMSTIDLTPIEQSKIECAKKLFSNEKLGVKFDKVDSYQTLLDIIKGM